MPIIKSSVAGLLLIILLIGFSLVLLSFSFKSNLITRRKKIAVAICVTNDDREEYVDAAAAAAESIYRISQKSKYDYELVAFVLPHTRKILPKLRAFGFKLIPTNLPVTLDEIAEGEYKDKVNQSGCCGLVEFTRLKVFLLSDYYRAIYIDTDHFFLQPFDELLDLPEDISLIYTNGTLWNEVLSSGFFIVRPNRTIYNAITSLVKKGDFRYDGSGWEGSNIGWVYGGALVQGVLPFYYMKKLPNYCSFRAERYIYNNQAADEHERNFSVEQMKGIHLSICQKPWVCTGWTPTRNALCHFQENKWWELTHAYLDRLNISRNPICNRSDSSLLQDYEPIKI